MPNKSKNLFQLPFADMHIIYTIIRHVALILCNTIGCTANIAEEWPNEIRMMHPLQGPMKAPPLLQGQVLFLGCNKIYRCN